MDAGREAERSNRIVEYGVCLGFAVSMYLIKLPWLDLPVWDDASIYHYGAEMWRGRLDRLNIQWSPNLVALAAAVHGISAFRAVVGFYVFHGLGYAVLAAGFLSVSLPLVGGRGTAVFSTCAWIVFVHAVAPVSGIPVLHLYHNGIVLLAAGYFLRSRPVGKAASAGVLAFAFITRNESVIVLIPMLAAGALRRHSLGRSAWGGGRALAAAVWIPAAALILAMCAHPRNFRMERFEIAFQQQFYAHALNRGLHGAVPPPSRPNETAVIENAFRPGAAGDSVLGLARRNPEAFADFVASRFAILAGGGLLPRFPGFFSHTFAAWFVCGGVALAAASLRRASPRELLLFAALAAKIPLLLLTVPRFHYALDVLFMGCAAVWPVIAPRRGGWIAGAASAAVLALAVLAMAMTGGGGRDELRNYHRARFVRNAGLSMDFRGAVLAERYAPFSKAFGDSSIGESVSYFDLEPRGGVWHTPGGKPCDYLLFETGSVIPAPLARWACSRRPAAESGMFPLYRQAARGETRMAAARAGMRRVLSAQHPVIVKDSTAAERDLGFRTDYDAPGAGELVVAWDPGLMGLDKSRSAGTHVYVRTGDGPFVYLGHPREPGAEALRWTAGNPDIQPAFIDGPRMGQVYQFRVHPLMRGVRTQPKPFPAAGPVLLAPAAAVLDRRDPGGRSAESAGAIEIRWVYDETRTDGFALADTHVYVSPDGGGFEYLGRSGGPGASDFIWRRGCDPNTAEAFRGGPVPGRKYRFAIYHILTGNGAAEKIIGPVECAENGVPPPLDG